MTNGLSVSFLVAESFDADLIQSFHCHADAVVGNNDELIFISI